MDWHVDERWHQTGDGLNMKTGITSYDLGKSSSPSTTITWRFTSKRPTTTISLMKKETHTTSIHTSLACILFGSILTSPLSNVSKATENEVVAYAWVCNSLPERYDRRFGTEGQEENMRKIGPMMEGS